MNVNRAKFFRGVAIAVALVEYAGIAGVGIWAVWYHRAGTSGDMPFELLLIPLSLIAILMGWASGYVVLRKCLRLGDTREAAIAWGALAAAFAPWLSLSTVMWCTFTPLQLVSGFVLSPMVALYLRTTAILFRLQDSCSSDVEKLATRRRVGLRITAACVTVLMYVGLIFVVRQGT